MNHSAALLRVVGWLAPLALLVAACGESTAAARPVAGADSAGYAVLANVTRSLLPAIEKYGIATAAEVDIDTLADRLRDATVAANACWLSPVMVGAWARIGAG